MLRLMRDLLKLILWVVIRLFRSRASLEAEIMALRHQLIVLRRTSPKRLAFSNFDRLIFACPCRNSDPNIVMVQSAENWIGMNASNDVNGPR